MRQSPPASAKSQSPYALCRQMGHDLRQPLHGLGMLLSVLDAHVSDAHGRQTMAYVNDALVDLQRTVDRYAELARREEAPKVVSGLHGSEVLLLGPSGLQAMRTVFEAQGAAVDRVQKLSVLWQLVAVDGRRPRCVLALVPAPLAGEHLTVLLSLAQIAPECAVALLLDGKASALQEDIARRAGISLLPWPTSPEALLAALGVVPDASDDAYVFLDFPDAPSNA